MQHSRDWITLAHGVGGVEDLPIPRDLAIAGSVAALVVSFTVLALAWRAPRFESGPGHRPAPRWVGALVDAPWFVPVARAFGLLAMGWFAFAAIFGEDVLINPAIGMFYVLLWVGIVPASLLLGPFYRTISPVRAINRLIAKVARTDPAEGLYELPARLGIWPATVTLFAFAWLELVVPDPTEVGVIRLWWAAYLAAMLILGVLFGEDAYARVDPFEVFSTLVGRLSVWGRHDGVLVVLSPLRNLASTPAVPGLVAVAGVLLGSTSFDSFRESVLWADAVAAGSRSVPEVLIGTAGLLGFCVGVGGVFALACSATGVTPGTSRRGLGDRFAHSLVPILVGYFVAHYLTSFAEFGQTVVIQMSDPLSDGSNLLGTGGWSTTYFLTLHPTALAVTKVLGIVLGHILGAVAAHDRALGLLPRRHQLTGQLPVLAVMVGFTAGGLLLLFAA